MILHFLLFAGVSILLFAGLVILSEKLFYQGAIGLGEISAKRRRISRAEIERKVSTGRHPVRAIFWREVKLMNRTPIFLLNGLLVVVIVPVIFMAGVIEPRGPESFILGLQDGWGGESGNHDLGSGSLLPGLRLPQRDGLIGFFQGRPAVLDFEGSPRPLAAAGGG